MAEWKIGEIRQIDNEWYQCCRLDCNDCRHQCKACDFNSVSICHYKVGECFYECREDNENVVFKKLEKVGEPYEHYEKLYQCYKLPMKTEIRLLPDNCYPIGKDNLVEIEIKQNKMEEKKIQHYDCFFDGKSSKSNLKPFNLEEAKAGKPVCTRDGRKARIICFDKKCLDSQILIVLVDCCEEESMYFYTTDGKCIDDFSDYDLMMLPEKRKGWINIHQYDVYKTKEEAEAKIFDKANYLTTIEIEYWR